MNDLRVARRLEKVLVTIESVWVGIFLGVGLGLIFGVKLGAIGGMMSFLIIIGYKRYILKREKK